MSVFVGAKVVTYSEFKNLVTMMGLNQYCFYNSDTTPHFQCLCIDVPANHSVLFDVEVSAPSTFTTDFPNAVEFTIFPFPVS